MFEKKFNWKIWFFILLFGGILLLASHVLFSLVTNQIVDENGLNLSPLLIGFLCFMICLVFITYAATLIALLKRVVVYKKTAFRIDEAGIHNTVVFVNLFAFVIVADIKFIPWSAVCYIDNEEADYIYIRVKKKQVCASFIGKLLIGILGYQFCYSFTTEKLSPEERAVISSYCESQSTCSTPENISNLSDLF